MGTKSENPLNSDVLLNDVLDMSDIGVYVTDYETGELLLYNAVYENIVPLASVCSKPELAGTKCYSHHGYETFCPLCPRRKLIDEAGNPLPPVQCEMLVESLGAWLLSTFRLIRWHDGRLAQICTFTDISRAKQQEERMAHMAYFDQRLDIPNGMRLFLDLLSNKHSKPFMIILDLSGLRKINEVYGRDSGDALLECVRDWLLIAKGFNAELYRIGGDEFVLSGFGCEYEEIIRIANMIWERFSEPWLIPIGTVSQRIFIGISLGVIPEVKDFETYPDLMNLAERLLNSAQKKGSILIYDDRINNDFQKKLRLEISLRECVLNRMQGFYVMYQPIVDPHTETWTGLEALCRWTSPEFGNVPPLEFIEVAEQIGLISIIGDWILEESVRQVKQWGLDAHEKFLLDVNLSPIQLNDETLCEKVESLLTKYNYPARQLSLEITESVEIKFHDHINHSLQRLDDMGVVLSLDDFGTGYSTFSTLRSLPLKIVKTDRSFSQNIETDSYMQHTMHVMIEFAHVAGMRVVAEGVETDDQRRVLLVEGADLLQGYYYAKPLSVEDIEANLHRFHTPKVQLSPKAEVINIDMLASQSGMYALSLTQYKQFSRCVRILSSGRYPVAKTLDMALQAICEGMCASICFAYVFDETITGTNIHFFCDHEVHLNQDRIREVVDYFVSQNNDKDLVYANNRATMSEYTRNAFPSVQSILALPIKHSDSRWGIIGVCETTLQNRTWTREEIQLIALFGDELGQTLCLSSLENKARCANS